ncbi:hypothetical protein [Microvirga sp. CF3016]|uniref:hypothetical protein n=1 Tax=Microvirga sp. CF3016 TaxID=3110181 RepID=UPI002E79FF2A|nr:hypothetical protein [Microvirga sp. CF3016]MEE1610161.1 hypothetical protein [Microvirga sp. CF3016]
MKLDLGNILLLLGYVLFMALGQIAFKYVAKELASSASLIDTAMRLPFSISFWATGALYGLSMIYWIWLLSRVPLTIAYPFASLSIIVLPMLSWAIYSEPLSLKYFLGVSLMMFGIALVIT